MIDLGQRLHQAVRADVLFEELANQARQADEADVAARPTSSGWKPRQMLQSFWTYRRDRTEPIGGNA